MPYIATVRIVLADRVVEAGEAIEPGDLDPAVWETMLSNGRVTEGEPAEPDEPELPVEEPKPA